MSIKYTSISQTTTHSHVNVSGISNPYGQLMTRVNEPLSIVTPASSTKGYYATEVVLTSRSSATRSTPSRNHERGLAVSSCGFSGRGRNSVPHLMCKALVTEHGTSHITHSKATISVPSGKGWKPMKPQD